MFTFPVAHFSSSGFRINKSALFVKSDAEYLSADDGFGTPTNADIGTLSMWFKRASVGGSNLRLFTHGSGGSVQIQAYFKSDNKLVVGNGSEVTTTQTFASTTDWQNLVVRVDTSQSTSSDRVRLYLNGSKITGFDAASYPSQNGDVFTSTGWRIASWTGSTTSTFDGRMAEVIYCDGQSLAPTAFAEDDDGTWKPIDVSDSGLFSPSDSVVPTSTTWTLGSTLSAGTGTLDKSGAGGTSGLYTETLIGDFKVTFTAAALNDALFGVFDYSEIGTFNSSQDDGFLDSMTNSFWYDEGQTDVNYGSATVAASKTIAAGSVVTIERSGSTIKITDDGADVHSFSQTFSGPVGFIAGHRNTGANSLDFNSISFDGVDSVGSNSFYLNFASSGSDLGDDASGNSNDFTNNNAATQSTDTPTS